jgi:hypothetical protein
MLLLAPLLCNSSSCSYCFPCFTTEVYIADGSTAFNSSSRWLPCFATAAHVAVGAPALQTAAHVAVGALALQQQLMLLLASLL